MNRSRLAGHAAASSAASVVWWVAISLPAGAAPWWLWVAGVAPQGIAAVSLGLQEWADANDRSKASEAAEHQPAVPSPRPTRRALPAGREATR